MIPRFLTGHDVNPHRNLAREEALLLACDRGEIDSPLLYLWQNANTVVIGRAQNAWRECATERMREEGCTLARRTTGGGAVFHDLGNLNFSFIVPRAQYDLARQLSVIQAAVGSFGIACEFSGRNDLLAGGRKFSGNAFRFLNGAALHHGTLLVRADGARMARFLQPSKEKLEAKGVKSVPSRVVNLSELSADVTVERLSGALRRAFEAEYGPGGAGGADALELPDYAALAARNATWDWNYGETLAFDAAFQHRFPWGGVELQLRLENGRVAAARAFTDAMDADLGEKLETALMGRRFAPKELSEAVTPVNEDAAAWLGALEL